MSEPNTSMPAAAAESEADAQDEETIMPWLWGGVGLLAIAAFVAAMMFAIPHGHVIAHPAAAAPLIGPPS
jgi:hypothetical protein